MKKILFAALALTLTVSLSACGAKAPEDPAPAPDPTDAPTAQMHNPVHYGTAEQVEAETGFRLTAPEGAYDVQFSSVEGNPAMAQMSFWLDGKHYVYRVLADGTEKDISGMYYTWSSEAESEVGGHAAKMYWIEGKQGHISWIDDAAGIHYDLSMDDGAAEQALTDAAVLTISAKVENSSRRFAMDFSAALSDFYDKVQPGTSGVSLRYAAFASELADLFTECSPTQDDVTNSMEGFIETLSSEQMRQFPIQLNSTLTIFRELVSDHGEDLQSACGYEPKYEWDAEALEPLFRAMYMAAPWDTAYAGIVDQYVSAVQNGDNRQAMRSKNLNDLAADIGDTPLETLGYTIDDLDGNGIQELAIGTISDNDFFHALILDLYTLDEAGVPKLLFRSGERDRLYSEGSNIFTNVGSSGAANSFSTTLELKNGEFIDLDKETPAEYYSQLDLTPLSEW